MTDMTEIKTLVEGVNGSFADLQSEMNSMKGRVDALDDLKLDKITEDITGKLDSMQKEQQKLHAALNRQEQDNDVESKAFEKDQAEKFDSWFRKECVERSKVEITTKAMSTDVNVEGGYLVRPGLAQMVVDRVFETSPLRLVANVETTGNKSIEMLIDDDEADATWEGEGSASVSDSDTPQVRNLEIVVHKIATSPKISQEQLDDSYLNVEQWLANKVSDKFARAENTAFVEGNGVRKPRGFLTYDAWDTAGTYQRDAIEQIDMGSASALTANGLIEVQNALKEPYQGRAVFGMKRATYGAALKLAGNDQYFFGQTLIKDGQLEAQLLGKKVIFMDDMPAVASDALAVVYGDFSKGYTILDRVGLVVLRDPFSSQGQVSFYTTKRVGGAVTNFDSLKIGKVST
jgi:HK97 family phage major capsid protein